MAAFDANSQGTGPLVSKQNAAGGATNWGALAGLLGGGLLGGLAGSGHSNTMQGYNTILAPASDLENQGGAAAGDALSQLQKLIGLGPGSQDMSNSLQSQNSLAQMLQQYSQGGNLPTGQDIQRSQALTQQMFAPQQMQLNQSFQDAQKYGNRQAALMGRGGNDPVLMNKLMQEQTRQQQMLGSQMTAYGAQQAQQMPLDRLNYANQFAQVQGNLASQALANRQALFSLGSQLKGQEQNFRAGTANRQMQTTGGGGLQDIIGGALGAAGIGAKIAGLF